MDGLTIRYANMGDYMEVEKIMHQVQELHVNWRPDIYKNNDVILPYDMFQDALRDNTFIVAEMEGKVVGLLFYMIKHIESGLHVTRDVLFVDSMAVDEMYRGRGIGHRLFDFIKDMKQRKNLDGIELQVNARNKSAMEMYQKYGFTEKSINMELL